MTDEQCARMKAQLERLRNIEKRVIDLPDSVKDLEFPDLSDEYDKLRAISEALEDDDIEGHISSMTNRISWYERYISACHKWMEQQNENQTV